MVGIVTVGWEGYLEFVDIFKVFVIVFRNVCDVNGFGELFRVIIDIGLDGFKVVSEVRNKCGNDCVVYGEKIIVVCDDGVLLICRLKDDITGWWIDVMVIILRKDMNAIRIDISIESKVKETCV